MSFYTNSAVCARLFAALDLYEIQKPEHVISDSHLHELIARVQKHDPYQYAVIMYDLKFTFTFNGKVYGCLASEPYTKGRKMCIIGDSRSDSNVGKHFKVKPNFQVCANPYPHFDVEEVEVKPFQNEVFEFDVFTAAYQVPKWHLAWRES